MARSLLAHFAGMGIKKTLNFILDLKSTSALNISALLIFKKNSNSFNHSLVETVPMLKTNNDGWEKEMQKS